MGGVVVLGWWFLHQSGARYLFVGMILPQLGGNGGNEGASGFWGGGEWDERFPNLRFISVNHP